MKRLVIDDKHFRMRRGKLVEIPTKWVGQVTHRQTIRKRLSKTAKKNSHHGMKSVGLSQ